MDETTTGTAGVGQTMPNGSQDDLDARLSKRVEEVASGFRSTIDKRLGTIERAAQAYPLVQNQIQDLNRRLSEIQGYFQKAEESQLDPEERQRREEARQAQQWNAERAQLILNARQNNAAFKIMQALSKLGYEWNDSRLTWAPDQWNADPEGFTSAIIAEAYTKKAQEADENVRREETRAQAQVAARRQEVQENQQVQEANQRRAASAQLQETASPGGEQADWIDKVRQMDPKERTRWIASRMDDIRHNRIEYPWQRPPK